VLKYIEMYMKADNSDLLAEALTESLKNIIMVMHTSGILRPKTGGTDPDSMRQDALWDISWEEINKFCPKLKNDFLGVVNSSNKTTVNTKPQT